MTDITLETVNGALPAYHRTPDPAVHGTGPFPGVVVLHDATGTGADTVRIADRVAAQGYEVLAPDLFARGPRALCITRVMRDLVQRRGPAIDDILAAKDWLAARPNTTGAVGVIGFCLGGGFAIITASKGFDVAAPFYGTTVGSLDSILEGACPMVASFGDRDPLLPFGARRLTRALDRHGIEHDIKSYPGAGHSFANQTDLGPVTPVLRVTGFAYTEPAAEDAWQRVFGFFRTHLPR